MTLQTISRVTLAALWLWISAAQGNAKDAKAPNLEEAAVVALFRKAIETGDPKEVDHVIRLHRQALDSQDASGKTGLHYAAETGDKAILKPFSQARANGHIADKGGKKAVDYAPDAVTRKLLEWLAGLDPGNGVAPTFVDLEYGPDPNDLMNVWLVDSGKPSAVIVQIHGGGFTNGRRQRVLGEDLVNRLQEAGVSFVSTDYRFVDPNPPDIQTSVRDLHETLKHIARAIQFVRSNRDAWNIDPQALGCTGGSAGAAAAMWLAFHDDMAEPDSPDPVLRESTRIACAYVTNVALPSNDPLNPEIIRLAQAMPFKKTMDSRLRALGLSAFEEARPLLDTPEMLGLRADMGIVELITPGDPPVALHNIRPFDTYDGNIHNPHSVPVIRDYCVRNGVECLAIMYNTPKEEQIDAYSYLIGKLTEHGEVP